MNSTRKLPKNQPEVFLRGNYYATRYFRRINFLRSFIPRGEKGTFPRQSFHHQGIRTSWEGTSSQGQWPFCASTSLPSLGSSQPRKARAPSARTRSSRPSPKSTRAVTRGLSTDSRPGRRFSNPQTRIGPGMCVIYFLTKMFQGTIPTCNDMKRSGLLCCETCNCDKVWGKVNEIFLRTVRIHNQNQ